MIYEHTGQLITDRPVQQRRHHRRVHSAREAEQHLRRSDLSANAIDCVVDDVADAPQSVAPGYFADEALENSRALQSVSHFRMELHAVEAALLVAHRRKRNGIRGRRGNESLGELGDAVAMAHPHIEHRAPAVVTPILDQVEQAGRIGDSDLCVTELALRGWRDATAQLLRHGLHAVADAQHRNAERESRLGRLRRICIGDGLGTAGKNDSARFERADLLVRDVPRIDLAIHAQLAHATRDELRVLGPEVENQDAVSVDVRCGLAQSDSGNCHQETL